MLHPNESTTTVHALPTANQK